MSPDRLVGLGLVTVWQPADEDDEPVSLTPEKTRPPRRANASEAVSTPTVGGAVERESVARDARGPYVVCTGYRNRKGHEPPMTREGLEAARACMRDVQASHPERWVAIVDPDGALLELYMLEWVRYPVETGDGRTVEVPDA